MQMPRPGRLRPYHLLHAPPSTTRSLRRPAPRRRAPPLSAAPDPGLYGPTARPGRRGPPHRRRPPSSRRRARPAARPVAPYGERPDRTGSPAPETWPGLAPPGALPPRAQHPGASVISTAPGAAAALSAAGGASGRGSGSAWAGPVTGTSRRASTRPSRTATSGSPEASAAAGPGQPSSGPQTQLINISQHQPFRILRLTERTRPRAAAAARSVTRSPSAAATAPQVTTISRAWLRRSSASHRCTSSSTCPVRTPATSPGTASRGAGLRPPTTAGGAAPPATAATSSPSPGCRTPSSAAASSPPSSSPTTAHLPASAPVWASKARHRPPPRP